MKYLETEEQVTYLKELQEDVIREFDRLLIYERMPWKDEPLHSGDVVWVDFDMGVDFSVESSRVQKLRPAVVFQNEVTSQYSNNIMVIPVTSSKRKLTDPHYPNITHKMTGTKVEGALMVNQLQPVGKNQIVEREAFGEKWDYKHKLYPEILRAFAGLVDPDMINYEE